MIDVAPSTGLRKWFGASPSAPGLRFRTTVGLKVLMAASGVVLVAFLVFHLFGNLLVYRGPAALNSYSALLLREPALLWIARAVLFVSALVHVGAAARLWMTDRRARPVRYRRLAPRSATLASRSMRLTGIGLAAFIVFHILHFTTGTIAPVPFGELGYRVHCFCFQDSPRRAHSIAAQGGINAAKNYRNDGDSVWRLFHDTLKGGDFRSREANVYRLAQVSNQIIDQCVAQGIPFAREYGGMLATRSFGGALVSRTFYARGQTGQQLLLGAYQALERQVRSGQVRMHPRSEMLDMVVFEGRARGLVVRDLLNGALRSFAGDAVVLATGGYANVYYLSTNARGANATAIWRAYRRGAGFANPCFTQIHPTCIPASGTYQSKLTLMSESLRNDARVWVPRCKGDDRPPGDIPADERDYFLERRYPTYGNLTPRDIASRAVKEVCDEGLGVGPGARGVYLDLAEALRRLGERTVRERYGNVLEMYEQITGDDPYRSPMRIYPAAHYTMGGLWVDYDLRSTIAGLYVLGEANYSDHGANRLGASALMQGLADGYFILPNTLSDELARTGSSNIDTGHEAFRDAEREVKAKIDRLLSARGTRTVDDHFRELGSVLWEHCGMDRDARGLTSALERIPALHAGFERDLRLPDPGVSLNESLERAGRLADFYELAELMCLDALERRESCGAHFRKEHQTPDGEAQRDDEHFAHVSVWEYQGEGKLPLLHKEPLSFEAIAPARRSYQ